MFETMSRKIELLGIIPVVKIENPVKAVNVVKSLVDGGIRAAEVTFRTLEKKQGIENIVQCIAAIAKAYPDILLGAGTVINPELARRAVEAGAQFIVSAGYNPETVSWCIDNNIPVYPGVNCASQIEESLSKGLSVLKFFPAEISGGVKTLKALSGPFPQVKFIATGGINEENVSEYIKCDNVLAVSETWMFKPSLIQNNNWKEITSLSRRAVCKMLGFRFAHLGINFENDAEAAKGAALLDIFGYSGRETPASWFSGDSFELMKKDGRGVHGHIGFFTWNIERALKYLSFFGFFPVKETAVWSGEPEKSYLTFIYLDKNVAGFDIHLKRI